MMNHLAVQKKRAGRAGAILRCALVRLEQFPRMPRSHRAYNPPWLNDGMVVRGGFGVFVQPQTLSSLNASGVVSSNAQSFQSGFSASTTYTSSVDSYYNNCANGAVGGATCSDPGDTAFTLSNPFPGGFVQPAGSAAGASTFRS
jgi:hypothetical protein